MGVDPRAEIFTAVRAKARPGIFNDPGNVLALDNVLDAFDVPRAGVATVGSQRQINSKGRKIITDSEGYSLKAYLCPANVWTIGRGTTIINGKPVRQGMEITPEQAEEYFSADLRKFEDAVAKLVGNHATDNQYSAMVSLAYNIGAGDGGLKTSTLLRKHNEGDYKGARAEFAKWNKGRVNGVLRVLPGLVKRRAEEAELYGS